MSELKKQLKIIVDKHGEKEVEDCLRDLKADSMMLKNATPITIKFNPYFTANYYQQIFKAQKKREPIK